MRLVPWGSDDDDSASEAPNSSRPSWLYTALQTIGLWIVWGLVFFYLGCALALFTYRFVDPWTTGVQIQRRLEADASYEKRYAPRPLSSIDQDLPLAVVSAEDTRFFQHRGIDWDAIAEAIEENRDGDDRQRGGSSISQQLVKNLFLTTHSTYLRKALELPLTYLAELILSKRRILELYLNVIEWGPGVYGAEAAAQYHYGHSVSQLTRYQAAALAACIPNPRVRRPHQMDDYARIIRRRMEIIAPLRHLGMSVGKENRSSGPLARPMLTRPPTPPFTRSFSSTTDNKPSPHGN